MKTRPTRALALLLLFFPLVCSAQILFDGSLETALNQQGWAYLTNPLFGAQASQTVNPSGTLLDTRAPIGEQAGYFSFNLPGNILINSNEGFGLRFIVNLRDEQHTSENRAGFSVLVIDQQLRAIELGFWKNRIWAQHDDPLFTQAESTEFYTQSETHYYLYLLQEHYHLFANNQLILQGDLRDYTAFNSNIDPYETANLIFLGDNAGAAGALAQISYIAISAPEFSVPLPSWAYILSALLLLFISLTCRPSLSHSL